MLHLSEVVTGGSENEKYFLRPVANPVNPETLSGA